MTSGFEEGCQAFRQERWDEALGAWERLGVEEGPRSRAARAEAHFRRALGLADPAGELQAALVLAPEEGRYWYHLGLARHRNQDWAGADAAYGRASDLGYARRPQLAYVRGLLALDRGQEPEAEQAVFLKPFLALLRRDWPTLVALPPLPAVKPSRGTPAAPGLAALFRGLGQAGLGHGAQAIQTLGALAPDGFPAPVEALRVLALAGALDATGQGTEAARLRVAAFARTRSPLLVTASLATLEAALKTGHRAEVVGLGCASQASPRLQALLSAALFHLGQEAAARGLWAEASGDWSMLADLLARGPWKAGSGPVHHNLALALERQERWDAAADAWLAAAAALPKRVKAGAMAGLRQRRDWLERRALDLRRRTGRGREVLRQEKAMLRRHVGDLDLRLEHAHTLLTQERPRSALREVQAMLRQAPGHAGALELAAQCQVQEGDLPAGERLLREVLALHPGRHSACQGLAAVLKLRAEDLCLMGIHRQAATVLEEACALMPQDYAARITLAECYLHRQEPQRAQAHLEAALARGGAHAYELVFAVQATQGDLAAARALVARGEAAGLLREPFYVQAGWHCLGAAEVEALRGRKVLGPWEAFARELFDKAMVTGGSGKVLPRILAILRRET